MFIMFDRIFVDRVQETIIDYSGGSRGVLNSGAIDSALASPMVSFGGVDLFDTDIKKCCKLFHALVSNHGYVDGNKRIGLYMFFVSLEMCSIDYSKITQDYAVNVTLRIASGALSVDGLIEEIEKLL